MQPLLQQVAHGLNRAMTHRELQLAHEYMGNILSSMLTSLIVIDPDGEIKTVNPATLELLGYSMAELVGKDLSCVCADGSAGNPLHAEELVRRETVVREETMYRKSDGSLVPVLFSSSVLRGDDDQIDGVVCSALDIADRRLAQEALERSRDELAEANRRLKENQAQLLQSDKMATIGQIASGVAHEINNPVGFILSNLNTMGEYVDGLTSLLQVYEELEKRVESEASYDVRDLLDRLRTVKEEMDLDFVLDDIDDVVSESREGAERVRKIIQDLREFAHIDRPQKMPADINAGLENTLHIIHNELKYKVDVKREFGDLPEVLCYPMELNQVFLNLLLNSAQAIEDKGQITVRTYVDDGHVCIAISDTGVGMTPEVQRRIFDPFFTTKDVGHGTGLGLSMSYNIVVDKHHGEILVDSEEGKGSTFTVRIPAVEPNPT